MNGGDVSATSRMAMRTVHYICVRGGEMEAIYLAARGNVIGRRKICGIYACHQTCVFRGAEKHASRTYFSVENGILVPLHTKYFARPRRDARGSGRH